MIATKTFHFDSDTIGLPGDWRDVAVTIEAEYIYEKGAGRDEYDDFESCDITDIDIEKGFSHEDERKIEEWVLDNADRILDEFDWVDVAAEYRAYKADEWYDMMREERALR